MDNLICRRVTAMLSAYIENKLREEERLFIEDHFSKCAACRKKFYEMSEIMGSLHFEYEKLINEFDKIEANKIFNIKEYEAFYKNISPYVDDELCYEDSLKFRKYLLKSKQARDELSNVYVLRNNIKKSAANFMDKANVNYSKKIIKKIKEEDKYLFPNIYKRAVIAIGFMISALAALVIFIGYNFFNQSFADTMPEKIGENIQFPDNGNFVEFFFDKDGNLLFTDK